MVGVTKLSTESSTTSALAGFIPTKKNKRRYNIDNEIKAILRDMISKKEKTMRDGQLENNDLLGLLLQCKEESNKGMKIEDIIEECKLFYFAGQESTATLLTWTMILLSMHPDWQEKARDEVLQICGKRPLDFEAISHLKIVDLYRRTIRKTNIGGMSIPTGVDFALPILLLHYDPKCWGEDVEEFNPERFSEGVVKASKDEIAFYPFGWGPRTCLGQSFVMIEAKMALAMVLQQFSFQLSSTYTHSPYKGITLQPQHVAPIILQRI
uniref:Uncharacterized protein n=1 Tax=Quercus lobata TaxID=97700 RepID=A0A7N2KTW4_QUELO